MNDMLEAMTKDVKTGNALPIMEAFLTIQGEGYHTGKSAYFIRTAGCDVGCVWCDVKASWVAEDHPVLSIEDIVSGAAKHPARIAVITGGEPLMYPMGLLCNALKDKGFLVHLETSGAHPLSGSFDWICLSPKKFKEPKAEIYEQAHELKVIVYNKHDLTWAVEQAKKVSPECRLFLQPEWSRHEKVTPLITTFVMEHPEWCISLQTHKYLNIP